MAGFQARSRDGSLGTAFRQVTDFRHRSVGLQHLLDMPRSQPLSVSEAEPNAHQERDLSADLPTPVTDSARKYIGLLEVSRSIAFHRDFREVFHDLADRLHALVDFNFLVLVLYDPARNVMRLHVVNTANPGDIEVGNEYEMSESPSAFVWRTQQPLVIEDTGAEKRFPRVMRELREQGVRSICIFPLTSAHRRLGTLNFGSETPGAYKAAELDFPQLVTSQIAVAVDNALHFQEAQSLQSQLGRDRDRLQLLLDLNNRLVSNLDLRELFLAISSSVRRTMGCDYASLSLPPLSELKRVAAPKTHSGTLEDIEREHILQTLQDTKWVVGGPRGAAARLGLKRTSLVYKMQRLGISREFK
jgi:transcriptional regulator with GAF, ATPase, and Fis domain